MSIACESVLSSRGNIKLVIYDYIMTNDKCRDDFYYWRCEKKNGMKCSGYACTVLINGKHYLRTMSEHNHVSDPARKEIITLVENLRRKALETTDSSDELIRIETNVISAATFRSLPSYPALRQIVEKARRKLNKAIIINGKEKNTNNIKL